jgi:RHS repeat-associated protein
VISSYRYTLDADGNRTQVVEDTGRTVQYAYDALSRLVSETITDPVNGNRTMSYTYDPVGNRLTLNDSAEGETVSTYDANDRLLTETLGSQVTQYTYDNNGNTLSQVTSPTDQVFYHWDYQNRMIGADVTTSSGTQHTAYRYDADGNRVSATTGGVETRYLIDTVQPYAQVALEYRPSGLVVASYVYGNGLISQNRVGVLSYYAKDGLGSTRALTNANGVVTDRYVYDAFGRMISQTGSTVNSYLFAGQQRDAVTGLDYLRARYLSPETGTFFGRDAFPALLRNPITLPRYLYADDNPVNYTDPTGMQVSLADVTAAIEIVGILQLSSSISYKLGHHEGRSINPNWQAVLVSSRLALGEGIVGVQAGGYVLTAVSDDTIDDYGDHLELQYVIPYYGASLGISGNPYSIGPEISGTKGTLKSPAWALTMPLPIPSLAFFGAVAFGSVLTGNVLSIGYSSPLSIASIGFGVGTFPGFSRVLSLNSIALTFAEIDFGFSLPVQLRIGKSFPDFIAMQQRLTLGG